MKYTRLDTLLTLIILLLVAVIVLRPVVAAPNVGMCDVRASETVWRRCISEQSSAALELRSEVVQLNNRLAVVEGRSVAAGASEERVWQLSQDAAYLTMCRYKVLKCK